MMIKLMFFASIRETLGVATENITVQHRKVETAYFVPKTRLLCLPVWDNMSNDLYDMLVGHEVGHALYTPVEDVQKIKEKKTSLVGTILIKIFF